MKKCASLMTMMSMTLIATQAISHEKMSPISDEQDTVELAPVVVTAKKMPSFTTSLSKEELNKRSFATGDVATLLDGIEGISLYTGGGVSSLPVMDGFADDRLKVTVDGMSITSACPNHMNPALSYAVPRAVGQVKAYAGVVPVSQGGDSIGGTIVVKSVPPDFAEPKEGLHTSGSASTFYRSNGDVKGADLSVNAASEKASATYTFNSIDSGNYKDSNGDVVGASRYKVRNHGLKVGVNSDTGLYTLGVGIQDIPVQGFPNQAMDMTSNESLSFNAGYKNTFEWGELEFQAFHQGVRHKMDILPEKSSGEMPMDTDAVDLGYSLMTTFHLDPNKTLKLGHEFHRFTLDDWWPPLSSGGFMAPHDFWNIRDGKRERLALFAEFDNQITDKFSTQLGARLEHVAMNTGNVQGYHSMADGSYTGMMGMGATPYSDLTYKTDADAFNARNHKRTDLNVDLTASARYKNSENETYDVGISRKNRSPNLHERYTWSNEAMMAGLMNNWFGDLNSYVGNLDLEPETAYTLKVSADWHDANQQDWQVKVSPFYTYVVDYINAVPNPSSNPYNMSMISGRRSLIFSNQDAYLYGVTLSAEKSLGEAFGQWMIRGDLNYTKGETTGGENLYNIMPLKTRLAIDHTLSPWSNTLEAVFVEGKRDTSDVRAEVKTAGYALFNYRTSYKINDSIRLDGSIENIFNQQYRLPLGGLEYATGGMMMSPQALRGAGLSVNAGLSISF